MSDQDQPETPLGRQSQDQRRAAETVALGREELEQLRQQTAGAGTTGSPSAPAEPAPAVPASAPAASAPAAGPPGASRTQLIVVAAVVAALALIVALALLV